MKKINKETLEKAVAIHEIYEFLELGMRKLPGYHGTQINGNEYYNPDIWATPIPIPEDDYLGLAGTPVHSWQIPFDHTVLKEGDVIVNEDFIELTYRQGYYILTTGVSEPTKHCYVSNWFCKWEKKVK